MTLIPTQYNLLDLGPTHDTVANFTLSDPSQVTASIKSYGRRNAPALFDSISPNGRDLPMEIFRSPSAAASVATWNATVKQYFNPENAIAGQAYLIATGDDAAVPLRIACVVTSFRPKPNFVNAYDVVLTALNPLFEANSATTSSANPATVTNGGTALALPSLALTTSTHKTHRAVTVKGSGDGGGAIAMPVRALLSDSAATSSNVFVFVEGNSVPCLITGGGGASSAVWFLCDTAADGATTTSADILYGTGLTNPLCGGLAAAGMDFANSSNSTWKWNDWSVLSNAARSGTWRPALVGKQSGVVAASYAITSDGATAVVQMGAPGAYDNSADSILLKVGAQAGLTNAWSATTVTTTNMDGVNCQAFARTRVPGSQTWSDVAGSPWKTNSTLTFPIDVDNANMFALGLENASASGGTAASYTAPTTKQTKTGSSSGNTTSGTAAFTPSPTTVLGNYLVAFVTARDAAGGSNLYTISAPSGWVLVNTQTITSSSGLKAWLYVRENSSAVSGAQTWTITRATGTVAWNAAVWFTELQNVPSAGSLTALTANNGSSGVSYSVTSNTDNQFMLGMVASQSVGTEVTPSLYLGGETELATVGPQSIWTYTQATVGTLNITAVYGGLTPAASIWFGLSFMGNVSAATGSSATPTGTLSVSGSASALALVAASQATVTVAGADNYDYYSGTYTVGTRTLTLTNVFAPTGTLTIDCGAKSISSSGTGPILWQDDATTPAVQFSDPDVWLALSPGSNTVTDGLSVTDTLTWRNAYV